MATSAFAAKRAAADKKEAAAAKSIALAIRLREEELAHLQQPEPEPDPADLTALSIPQLRVALLGDSTLDNVVWVDAPEQAVAPTLQRRLEARSAGASVINLAADGFTSADTLNGGPALISFTARRDAGDPLPGYDGQLDAPFAPLTHLEALSPPPTHVVLSVGGNDVREILGAMHELPQRIAAFHENYPQVAARCAAGGARTILMLQYRPDEATDEEHYGVYRAIEAATPGPGTAVQKLNALMEAIVSAAAPFASSSEASKQRLHSTRPSSRWRRRRAGTCWTCRTLSTSATQSCIATRSSRAPRAES